MPLRTPDANRSKKSCLTEALMPLVRQAFIDRTTAVPSPSNLFYMNFRWLFFPSYENSTALSSTTLCR